MNKTTDQAILCINITVLLRCMSYNRPVPCNELNTVAALLERPVVETRAHKTFFSNVNPLHYYALRVPHKADRWRFSVVYFRITHRLGRPRYVWEEYLYSVL